MMRIREMQVGMLQWDMFVLVTVCCVWIKRLVMFVRMVLIVQVFVVMNQPLMNVIVAMPFGQVEPNAQGHQLPSD
jgi:hypothetical protein